ncbi:cytochrome c oxidase accessory protein CcoG [Thalassotalea euphylliae]|uniref:cytochrome c oxidase accessory protein CcoG n=1 Tax=Thalassotalea euphylliae TaxID=1655234 RepID=UPI003637F6DD
MNQSYLSKENLIIKTSVSDDKIYIREQFGQFQRIRRYLSSLLMLMFIVIPFFRYQGHQAVLFDVEQQKLHFFAYTLFPQDLFIFSLLFALAAFSLFYVTKLYGRVWCGFTCPQTIWTLMFNWIERRVEGTHNQSKKLDSQPLTADKVVKKLVKHGLWGALSLLTALVFMSYFVPVEMLYLPFITLQSSALVAGWVLFFAGCTYVNAGWIREKMCQHMCPYSRFQSAMFDKSTSLVTYDAARGESRGKRKRNAEKAQGLGDCVDCDLCVQVCPVGIDIREGLQYECINCGLCVDACDTTMSKFNYAPGLISFAQEKAAIGGWRRHLGYAGVIGLIVISMGIWASMWTNFEVNVLRDRQALYRINEQGAVENTYVFKIRNKSNMPASYQVTLLSDADIQFTGNTSDIVVLPGELKTISLTAEYREAPANQRLDLAFDIEAKGSNHQLTKSSSFYTGDGGW